MPFLILCQAGSPNKSYSITKPVTTIGRSLSNDISLHDPFASRLHAQIVALEEGGYEIQDLGARHPITVNGEAVTRHILKDGDKIRLGDSVLIFQIADTAVLGDVKFLAAEDMSQETAEIATLPAKGAVPLQAGDLGSKDLATLRNDHQKLTLLYEFGRAVNSHLAK